MERFNKMRALYLLGYTLEEIGEKFNISRQRVQFLFYSLWPEYAMMNRHLRGSKMSAELMIKEAQERLYRAKKRNYKEMLPFEEIEWTNTCPFTGKAFDWFSNERTPESPTIERKNKALGFIPGNVYVISWKARKNMRKYKMYLTSQRQVCYNSPHA